MSDEAMFIPADRLPPGFADRLDGTPAEIAVPRPAATTVLLRDARDAPEVLLLRRNHSAGFVPGAYVFPGGRVDSADSDPRLLHHEARADRTPDFAYWAAAVRELFEETGVLLARSSGGGYARDATDPLIASEREALLQDRTTLADVLTRLGLVPAFDRMQPCAHWITPVAEPRRYDTHFFLAPLPEGRSTAADPREMSDAVWLTAAEALDRFRAGRLPMVFPTVRTLESVRSYHTVDEALDAFRGRLLTPVLPRLVRTQRGVALVVDEPQENHDGE